MEPMPSAGDDDDVAVLFTMPDGSKAFIIGNIEEVAVASGTVDSRRALSGTGAEYLRSLEKNYRKDGVMYGSTTPKACSSSAGTAR